jgi:hypothetical protein
VVAPAALMEWVPTRSRGKPLAGRDVALAAARTASSMSCPLMTVPDAGTDERGVVLGQCRREYSLRTAACTGSNAGSPEDVWWRVESLSPFLWMTRHIVTLVAVDSVAKSASESIGSCPHQSRMSSLRRGWVSLSSWVWAYSHTLRRKKNAKVTRSPTACSRGSLFDPYADVSHRIVDTGSASCLLGGGSSFL